MKKILICIYFFGFVILEAKSWNTQISYDDFTDEKNVTIAIASDEKGDINEPRLLAITSTKDGIIIFIVLNNLDFLEDSHKVKYRLDKKTPQETYNTGNKFTSVWYDTSKDKVKSLDKFLLELSTNKKLLVQIPTYTGDLRTLSFNLDGFYKTISQVDLSDTLLEKYYKRSEKKDNKDN